jgi:NAD(P)-dependent dehydrogenase (short-subunit alcohol dehydrogenase family)
VAQHAPGPLVVALAVAQHRLPVDYITGQTLMVDGGYTAR